MKRIKSVKLHEHLDIARRLDKLLEEATMTGLHFIDVIIILS